MQPLPQSIRKLIVGLGLAVAALGLHRLASPQPHEPHPFDPNVTRSGPSLLSVEALAPFGVPDVGEISIAPSMVLSYDAARRAAHFVAWKVDPARSYTLPRVAPARGFRVFPNSRIRISTSHYSGVSSDPLQGYARGHIMPFWAGGQDFNGDGRRAYRDANGNGRLDPQDTDTGGSMIVDDALDAYGVLWINQMGNVLPMHQSGFNNAPGLWYRIEQWEQSISAVSSNPRFYVIAGPVWGEGPVHLAGRRESIQVPPMFFRIVYAMPATPFQPPPVLAFLFPHQREAHGTTSDFLVSVDTIEALTGFNFFPSVPEESSRSWERPDSFAFRDSFPPLP